MNIMEKLPGMALLIIFSSCSSNVEMEHPSSPSFEVQQKNPLLFLFRGLRIQQNNYFQLEPEATVFKQIIPTKNLWVF